MNNYILLLEYLINIILYSAIFTNKYKERKQIHYELQKTKKYLKAHIQKDIINKPKYRTLDEKEKEVLVNILLNLKKENKDLYEFFKKVLLYTNKANIRNLGNNIQTLKIYKENKNKLIMILKDESTIGKYRPSENKIFLYDNKKTTINHELLHVSSSNTDCDTVGFNKIYSENNDLKYSEIGRGLNEGYTELLNNRISTERSYSYILLNKIAFLIELLFENKTDMKDHYFNSNVEGIIYELSKYIEKEEIIELLIDIDELYHTKSILMYYIIKKKLLKIAKENKTKEETKNFKKEYKQNHLVKIMRKSL